ncbi:MAG: hypothetical protein HY815_06230 [Candidatus Riflebacteria bacterium]|nr:hypothetical protein [Candidatus Riflebacteria bacterium]
MVQDRDIARSLVIRVARKSRSPKNVREIIYTIARFQRASRSHLGVAEQALTRTPGRSLRRRPADGPFTAAYLVHVALECALKARILFRSGCQDTDHLKRKDVGAYNALFRSREGHKLLALADHLRLSNLMTGDGGEWVEDACWKSMIFEERPYSLRYGAQTVKRDKAMEELRRAKKIVEVVLAGVQFVRGLGKRSDKR